MINIDKVDEQKRISADTLNKLIENTNFATTKSVGAGLYLNTSPAGNVIGLSQTVSSKTAGVTGTYQVMMTATYNMTTHELGRIFYFTNYSRGLLRSVTAPTYMNITTTVPETL